MYRNKLVPLFLENPNDVVLDIWIGSSEMMGIKAFTAELINPTAAAAVTPLTVSSIWDRWIDGTYRLAGNTNPDGFAWDLQPLKSGSIADTTTFAYSSGLYHQTQKPIKAKSINLDTTPYHYAILLGASTSAVNDNTATVATKLAHWSPLVTGSGELTNASTDMGALEHLKTNYVSPAIKNLQAAGKNVHIGCLYVSISGDALSGYAPADSGAWCAHMAMIRRDIEAHLGFVGIPTVILGVAQVEETDADEQDLVRDQQQLYVSLNEATTRYFDTRAYPTDDTVHFDAQSTFDLGWDVTAFRYAQTGLGLAPITKVF
jgi:hypothetical protein